MRHTSRITALVLVIAMFAACGGGGFAQSLRLTLALSPPLIDSLIASGVIPASARATYITDFTDLANGALSLKENLDACGGRSCKLGAVDIFAQVFFDVQRRGHLGSVAKLHNVEVIIKGIIESARIFYGAPPTTSGIPSTASSQQDNEALIKSQLKDLKLAMQP